MLGYTGRQVGKGRGGVALVRWKGGGGWGQKEWGHLFHIAAYTVGLDNRPGPLQTGYMTLGKLLNLSEALNCSSVKEPEEK